jgi:hypothetical protein
MESGGISDLGFLRLGRGFLETNGGPRLLMAAFVSVALLEFEATTRVEDATTCAAFFETKVPIEMSTIRIAWR